jgi:uncharacterized protein (UPF0335 family)
MNTDDERKLKSYIASIEGLEEQKAELSAEISEFYASAKESGLDTKAMRAVIKARKLEKVQREALQSRIDEYMSALGMLADTPLGRFAVESASSSH